MTIQEGKDYLRQNWRDGTTCPCCTQVVKLYPVKLNSSMVRVLGEMVRLSKFERYVHCIEELKTVNGDYAKLRHWGLVVPMPKDKAPEGKKATGYWKPTDLARQFMFEGLKLPEKVFIFNNTQYRVHDPELRMITFKQAMNNTFDYNDLMRNFMSYSERSQTNLFQ
jgi:hypothetical protein